MSAVVRAGRLLPMLLAGLTVLLFGCDVRDQVPGAAATAARAAATPIPTPVSPTNTPAIARAPSPSVPMARPTDSQWPLSEQGIADVRGRLDRAVSSWGLEGIEELLIDQVTISTPNGGERLSRNQAASWLRRRAGPGLRLMQIERHHHVALLVAQTEGWPNIAPIASGRVGFSFHLYGPTGRQDDEWGSWKVDVVTAE